MRKLYNAFCKLEVIICGTGLIALVALVFLSAVLRFFRLSVAWNMDLALLLLPWTAFLGAGIAWRSNQLAGIDLLTRKLPSFSKNIIKLVVCCIIACALLIIIIFGARLVWIERLRTFQSLPIPFFLVTLSLVVAGFSMLVSTIIKIRICILDFRQNEERGIV